MINGEGLFKLLKVLNSEKNKLRFEDLQNEFVGMKGFSSSNLCRIRNFYLSYKDNEKLAPMVREIAWSHNIIIFEKCKDDLQKEFYIKKVFTNC